MAQQERHLNSVDAHSLRLLVKKLNEIIDANKEELAFGNAIVGGNVNATATNYCHAVGMVRGLKLAIDLCQTVEDELLGRSPSQRVSAQH